jgi:hypothetical protein
LVQKTCVFLTVSGQIKWTEMAPINGTGEKQKEARGGPLEKKQGQLT